MKIKRTLVLILGFLALGLGSLGTIVPLLPTTPFILLATICFSYSSERFYKWTKNNPLFAPYIENYMEKRGLTKSFKIKNIVILWVSLSISMLIFRTPLMYVILSIVGVGVTTHLLMIKTRID
jgi:uncharacterized membrane protein YbaN (DUF454 family)